MRSKGSHALSRRDEPIWRERVRPRESMPEGSLLAFQELAEVDDVQDQQVFDLERQADVMEPGIVCAENDVDTGFLALFEDGAEIT